MTDLVQDLVYGVRMLGKSKGITLVAVLSLALDIGFNKAISPGYFLTMGVPWIQGRDFDWKDGTSSPAMVIVNETAARRFWSGESPLGKRLLQGTGDEGRRAEVIGVVRDTKVRPLGEDPRPQDFWSFFPACRLNRISKVDSLSLRIALLFWVAACRLAGAQSLLDAFPPETESTFEKFEYRIPMRDRVRLYTAVYVPKDRSARYPILLYRTRYGVRHYGVKDYAPVRELAWPGIGDPSHARYILVRQDVRGSFLSEGRFGRALVRSAPSASTADAFDEYVSDPAKPVPFIERLATDRTHDYMIQDQRFAAHRPDVLVYRTEALSADLTIAGPIRPSLFVSTTGTDSDWVVKLIDVYPDDASETAASTGTGPLRPGASMAGYQQLVRGDVLRGKFRESLSDPAPFVPGEPTRVTFEMLDVLHTFRKGHPHHGPDPELLVSARRQKSPVLRGHLPRERDRLPEGHGARLPVAVSGLVRRDGRPALTY